MVNPSENDLPRTIPPPPIYVAFLLAGFLLDRFWPVAVLPDRVQYTVGFIVIILSFAFLAWVLVHFRKAKTSFSSHHPAAALITEGPFRFSRNPAYISLTMLYVGIGIAADNFWVLILTVPALLVTHYTAIRPEERHLTKKFGDDYRRYKESVRRWV